MASFKHKNFNLYIPEEILIEILSRLPVKALKRFSCVCKTWPLLIRNSTFISRHLIQSTIKSNGGNLLITSHRSHSDNNTYMDVFVDGAFDAPIDSGKVLPSLGLTGDMNIISNSGLLCIDAYAYHSYVIWNPAMRFYREIPKGKIVKFDVCKNWQFLRFGVLRETNNYKLIRFLDEDGDGDYRTDLLDRCRTVLRVKKMQVYSRSTGLWRETNPTNTVHGYVIYNDCSQIQVKGVLYWVSSREAVNRTSYSIMGFEIREEKFLQLLAMPCNSNGWDYKLTEIEGSLALINCNPESYSYCVWKMNENGDGWDMKFRIEDLNRSWHVQSGWKNCLVLWNRERSYSVAFPAFFGQRSRTSDESFLSIQRLDGTQPIVVQEIKNCLVSYNSGYVPNVHSYVESLIHV